MDLRHKEHYLNVLMGPKSNKVNRQSLFFSFVDSINDRGGTLCGSGKLFIFIIF